MAITRGATQAAENASAASVSVTKPSAAVGDILIATGVGSSSNAALTLSGSWTAVSTLAVSSLYNIGMWYRVVDGTEPSSYVFTQSAAARISAQITTYTGVDTTTPIDATAVTATTNATTLVHAGITTATAGAMVIMAAGQDSSTNTNLTNPTGTTQVWENTTSVGKDHIFAEELRATAGATGTRTWTGGASALNMGAIHAALKPASAVGYTGSAAYTGNGLLTAVGSQGGSGGTTQHSIWGASAPAGATIGLYTDGSPNIRLGNSFYRYASSGSTMASGRCVGGKVWTPSGSPASVRIMAWSNVLDSAGTLSTTPLRDVTVSTNPGGWTTATWTAFDLPADAVGVLIGYEFVGSPSNYVASNNVRPGTGAVVALDGTKIAWAEHPCNGANGTFAAGYYKIGTGAISGQNSWYGVDIVVDEGAGSGGSTAFSGAAFLTGSGTLSASGNALTGADSSQTVSNFWVASSTPTTAVVVAKVSGGSNATLRVSTASDLSNPLTSSAATINANKYAYLTISGLSAGTQYYYGINIDGGKVTNLTGKFKTPASTATNFTFAFGSCANATNSGAFGRILARNPDLAFITGDLGYFDITSNDQAAFRAAYEAQLNGTMGDLTRQVSTHYTWSDHDFGDNNAVATAASAPAAQAVYRERVPYTGMVATDAKGIYRTFTYGRVRFIITDERSYKSSQAATDNSSKTVLGATQKQWLKDTITAATEKVIFWVGDIPWTDMVGADDEYANYNTERQELASFFTASGKNIIRVHGDMHALGADDGSNSPGGIPVLAAAPFYNLFSNKGSYTVGPYPTSGSSNIEQYGFVTVTDTPSSIQVSFVGYDTADASRVNYTKTYSFPVSGSAGFSGSGTLSATGTALTGGSTGLLTIAAENAQAGQARQFWHDGVGQTAIPGFVRSSYYTPGQTAQFSIDYTLNYTAEVWRLGWYNGDGARKVTTLTGTPANQPTPNTVPNSNGQIECSNWSVNLSWTIPSDATPGWYWLLLKGTNGTDFSQLVFCVSDKNNKKPVLVVSSESTWMGAYNYYGGKTAVTGGKSVYGSGGAMGDITTRALCATYDRPVVTRTGVPQTYFMNSEYPFIRFLERMGIEVGHTTNEQIDADPTILDGRTLIITTGHNEYISATVRDKFASLLASGSTNMLISSGNDFFWKVRFGTTDDTATTTRGRVMWCRKDTMNGPSTHTAGTAFRMSGTSVVAADGSDWTGTWQDTRWSGNASSAKLFGDIFIANGIRNDAIQVPFSLKGTPIWRNVPAVANLTSGQTYSLGAGSLGMEWDYPDPTEAANHPRTTLSSSTVSITNASDANGQNYTISGTYTHEIFSTQAPSGAWIINTSTTQWGWVLDDFHDRGSSIATDAGRQATLNMLVDLGATPSASSVSGAGLVNPTRVNPATYAVYGTPGSALFTGVGTLSASGVALTGGGVNYYSIHSTQTPAALDSTDTGEYTLGAIWAVTTSGLTIAKARYWKADSARDGQTINAAVWNEDTGAQLTTGSRVQLASDPIGWVDIPLNTTPVAVVGTTYNVGVVIPGGSPAKHYPYTTGGASTRITNGPIYTGITNWGRLVSSTGGVPARPNGVGSIDYFIDVVLTQENPNRAGSVALSGSGTLSVTGRAVTTGTAAITGSGTLTASGLKLNSALLSGSGTLSAVGSANGAASASFSGLGTLSTSGKPSVVAAVALSSLGTLSVVGKKVVTGTASYTGSGTLSAKAPIYAVFGGSGTLSAIGSSPKVIVAVALTGAGALDARVNLNFEAAVTFRNEGWLTAYNPNLTRDLKISSVSEPTATWGISAPQID